MIKEKAYAKINLFLNVTAKRIDGFHDLEMVMAAIDLFDVLTFKLLKTKDIIIKSNVQITKEVRDNLVYKIAKGLQSDFDIDYGVEINITKNIPIAAGLAGGSADAAAALRGLNKLWKIGLSLDDLSMIGKNYGSDIPFCIYNKLCVARGKGEEIVFLDKKLRLPVLIINPNVRIQTADVFNLVKKEELLSKKISNMTSGIYNGNYNLIENELFNSLERYAFEIEPKISEIKNQIRNLGVNGVLMSGSGATIFAISKDKKKLKRILEVFNDLYFKKLTKIR
ncbi:4-diphosphocytidyl-2-C-methyl-D-erythritol kinase [Candidatus Izimaplasma bacterium HR1]|jgi:4-diphosphocytidyl-2C-methyl-D-erythritol kinase|uniref:4-(cytidine 5'-diphospho)-2-C-methyl-D-erythritol kinase n=1 Tax=Candidatus Izimoplasma sp. HR1 TaxID=1541959 RepID=UPI0004F739E8|nr:4-diphosphocytidyl-2-C-methyl-D-erythritol kinase [Candidatus Izimaplasma bacterium HR1]